MTDFSFIRYPDQELFFINDELVGKQQETQFEAFNNPEVVRVYVFFCPSCGKTWGNRVPLRKAPRKIFQVLPRGCPKHSEFTDLLLGCEWNDLDRVGEEILAFHFLEITNEQTSSSSC